MSDLGSINPGTAFDKLTSLPSDIVANPCGLIAKYIFTDSYILNNGNSSISINEKDIAHSVDVKYKFKSPENAPSIQWADVTDGNVMVVNCY
jgi:hypothetical protein